jgi:xanthine/CO dehydrogenase XdhC/CoxF family maturation factor
MPASDIVNQRFGRLVAVSRAENAGKHTRWNFRCDCGGELTAFLEPVRSGRTRSCGCLRAEANRQRSFKHGHRCGYAATPTFKAYQGMKGKCLNPNDRCYASHGGAGVTIDRRWIDSFETFLADLGKRPKGAVLRRIDLSKPFEPGNCRWARKRRTTKLEPVWFVENGKRFSVTSFAKRVGIDPRKLRDRMAEFGETPADAAQAINPSRPGEPVPQIDYRLRHGLQFRENP